MKQGLFNTLTAYLGVAIGVLGLAAAAGVSVAVILNALTATVCLLLVGFRLIRRAEAQTRSF